MHFASFLSTWSSLDSPSISRIKRGRAGSEFCSISVHDGLLKCAMSLFEGSFGRSLWYEEAIVMTCGCQCVLCSEFRHCVAR